MKTVTVINQDFQTKLLEKSNNKNIVIPQAETSREQVSTLKSYSVVLDQALTTKDKKAVRQILENNEQQIITNTISSLHPSKVQPVLSQIHLALLEQPRNADKFLPWLKTILKVHLGTVFNSLDSKIKLQQIRKIIQKRLQTQNSLKKIQENTKWRNQEGDTFKFEPKFKYIEEQREDDEVQQQAMEQEMLQEDFGDYEDLQEFM